MASPAPTPNGTAGGDSPIAGKAAGLSAIPGLEGLQQGNNVQTTFSGVVRGTKETQSSLMVPSEQVAVHLNRMAKNGDTKYDLQLHPAELGRVDIRLEINKDGLVQASVMADNQQSLDLLQKDSRALERALQQAGLQTDSNSLNFSLRQQQDGASQQQHAQQHSNGRGNKWVEPSASEHVAQAKTLSFHVNSGAGRIDLTV